ncbi:MAG TPA: hypothetical protein VIG99_02150 [Myxococcaceae bacterium]|jgi:hypothetical protein
MSIERVSFEAKLQAPPAHEAQLVRDDPEDAFERSVREAMRREPPDSPGPPRWAYDDWPLPFASFWTALLLMGLCYPARALTLTLAAMLLGCWLGTRLDRWLRRHPRVGGRRVRFLLGVR